jgi:CDP-glucose 4,6-dehydratase
LSAAKARRMLGWRPQYDLDTSLEETIAWYRDYFAQPARSDCPNSSKAA